MKMILILIILMKILLLIMCNIINENNEIMK